MGQRSKGRYKSMTQEKARRTVDLVEEGRDVLVIEGKTTAKHDIEDDTATPDVDLGSSVEPTSRQIDGAISTPWMERIRGEDKTRDLLLTFPG
jgi:hypothetical protein